MTTAIPQAHEKLIQQLHLLSIETVQFSQQLAQKMRKALSCTREGMTLHTHAGKERSDFSWDLLIEKITTPIARHLALSSYNDMELECRQFLDRLNHSEAMQQAEKLLGESTRLDFRFSAPDHDTSLANEDWLDNTNAAIDRLAEFADAVMAHTERLTDKLETLAEPGSIAQPVRPASSTY